LKNYVNRESITSAFVFKALEIVNDAANWTKLTSIFRKRQKDRHQ